MSEEQQRDIMKKSIEVLTKFTGKKPRGWTAPAWDTSKETIKILEEFGIVRTPRKRKQVEAFKNTDQLLDRSTIIPSCTMTASFTMPQMAKKTGKKPTPKTKLRPGWNP